MKTVEYAEMERKEKSYWWHVGRLKVIDSQLEKHLTHRKHKILNIGCGTGGTIAVLERYGTVTNVDVSEEALRLLHENGYEGTLVAGNVLPYEDKQFDAVVAFDVLEHIGHDQEALLEWYRVLKKNGKLFITVPAYQWLWSGHDISLHHFRRYTVAKLKWDTTKAGFAPLFISYAIAFSLPLVAGFRFLNKLTKRQLTEQTSYVSLPRAVNRTFIILLEGEAKLLRHVALPFGTSVIGVFRKSK